MGTPRGAELPLYEENRRLRDRVSGLEEELVHLRRSLMDAERRHSGSSQPESDLQYKEVFDHISVCMFLVDVTSDGRFRYAGFNPAEEKVLGLSTAEVAGKFVEEVFAEDLAQKLSGNYRRCTEAGTPITYDDELDLPGGRRYFHSNLIPMRNAAGRIHRIVGACVDTTDFKRTQEEAIARQKLESLGVLAAGIAHDFNNLLGSILAEAELAESELDAGSSSAQEIQAIKDVATRAGEIVRELMVYAGQDEASLDSVDLSLLSLNPMLSAASCRQMTIGSGREFRYSCQSAQSRHQICIAQESEKGFGSPSPGYLLQYYPNSVGCARFREPPPLSPDRHAAQGRRFGSRPY